MHSSAPGAGGTGHHVSFRTMCGRQIQVGHLVLGGGGHPAQRVSLRIGASPDSDAGTWAGLTVGRGPAARRRSAHAGGRVRPPPANLRKAALSASV